MITGKLYLIPSGLSEGDPTEVLPPATLNIIRSLNHFIVEEIRTARRFLVRCQIPSRIDDLRFVIFNEHSRETDPHHYLTPALEGHDIGLLSEAGVPCVADPGGQIVQMAHQAGLRVVPLTGPSSILLALMASGFNGQNFAFAGYLPTDKIARVKKIREIERRMQQQDQTQIFIETPYRNIQLFDSLISTCSHDTLLCLATDLTGTGESILSRSISEWKKNKPDIHKKNTIFLLYHS